MSITLDTLTLPPDCQWTNEFDAVPVATSVARTLSGRLVVYETALSAGRPIDLGGEDAWISREGVLTLHGFASTAGWTGLLTLHDARQFTVRFRTQEEKPVEAVAVLPMADPDGEALYQLTAVRLETVA